MPKSGQQLPLDLADEFSQFRSRHINKLHFAAHSHHFWPDVTRDAHLRCWDDAAELSDMKWEYVLGRIWGDVRKGIAMHLKLPNPETLVPAPNTHELVSRLLSCLPQGRPAEIVTTDSEFHAFRRQCARLEEDKLLQVTIVPAEPFSSFQERFVKAIEQKPIVDMVFVSQVFFNSGFANELDELVNELSDLDAMFVIDGYHGFLARPTDLSRVSDRIFYLAGGYKYAMAGEGACFMHCPPGVEMRPRNTGWFAEFGNLSKQQVGVPYDEDGWRFMGSTFDPSGLYRMRASLHWLAAKGLTANVIHTHARALQRQFINGLSDDTEYALRPGSLLISLEDASIGNFLTFKCPKADTWRERFHSSGIIFDHRGDRLRVGFGLYHRANDVERLLARLSEIRQLE